MTSFPVHGEPVLVTGASGFVGACLVRRLLQMGAEVHVLLRREARTWRLDSIWNDLRVHDADLLNGPAVRSAVATIRPKAILHLATYGAYEVQADAERIIETNILGTYHLLDAAVAAGTQVFVNTGSSSEYGFKTEPMAESDRLEPNSFYAVAKSAQTHLCTLMAKRHELACVNFRLFSIYGPWEEPSRLMPTLIRRVRAGLPLTMTAPHTSRDFVYVDDAVDAMVAFERFTDLRGEVINLGSGRQTTLADVVATIQEVVSKTVEVHWGAMPHRHWDTNRWVADAAKAERVIGWSARHSLREGLSKMAAWMNEVGDDYGHDASRNTVRIGRHGTDHAPMDHRTVA